METSELTRKQKLALVWKNTHADFKGKLDGRKSIMTYRNGTCLVFLDDLTDEEIERKMGKARQ